MVKSKFNFKWFDIFMPIGTGFLAPILTIFAISNGYIKKPEEFIVSILTSLLFLGVIPLFYWIRSKYYHIDFVTKHGLKVSLGKKENRPTKEEIELWTDACINFWSDKKLLLTEKLVEKGNANYIHKKQVLSTVNNLRAIFTDKKKIGIFGRWFRGYSSGLDIVMTNNSVHSLFRHELSHPILRIIVPIMFKTFEGANKLHHTIFKLNNLGA